MANTATFSHTLLILKLCYDSHPILSSWFSSGQVRYEVTRPDGQVEEMSRSVYTYRLLVRFIKTARFCLALCQW